MEFWKRLNRASTIILAVTLRRPPVLAVLLDQRAGADYPRPPSASWLVRRLRERRAASAR